MTAGHDRPRSPQNGAAQHPGGRPVSPQATALTEDDAVFEGPLFDAFAAVVARQPNHLAVDDGNGRLSYAELRDRALVLGARIFATVPADGLVGVLVPTDMLYPVAWLACFAARRACLPLDPYLPPARSQAIIAEAGIAAVIVPTMTADLAAWLPANLPRIPMAHEPGANKPGVNDPGADELAAGDLGREPPPLPEGLPPARMGMLLFTSGSTGRAKGIALHERSTRRMAMNYAGIDLGPADRLLSLHPPLTSAGVRDTFGALLCGASLHMVDLKRDGLARALALLRAAGITVCATVPGVARALMAIDGTTDAFRGLRIMRLGGDAIMSNDIVTLARLLAPTARILVSLGMTEAGGAMVQRLIDPLAPVEQGRIAVGRPVPGQAVSIEDADGRPVRPGETGELVIRGRYLALGHWIAGRLDPTAFPADPQAPAIRSYRSGDLVLLRPDGMLVPLGRSDRQVKINGVRVEPGDTESTLRGLPGVADAAVLVHDDAGVPVLVAFIVPAQGDHAEPNAARFARGLRPKLAALLPPQQVPTHIHAVPAIPLLPSMKPDLAALRALLLGKKASGVIARVWTALRRAASLSAAAPALPPVRRDDAPS